ncbi:MAG TPA: metallophosphoesterase, partial [Acidimicrobiales bacterium]|nr:metallophosphoesterase [Acidimicrobiales bacterium]
MASTVLSAVTTAPVLVAAGDIACSPSSPSFNGGLGTTNPPACQEAATAQEIASIAPSYLVPLGDNQYANTTTQGTQPTMSDYQGSYDATWGKLASTQGGPVPNANVHPVPGNSEYGDVNDSGQPPLSNGSNYYANFGASGLNELPSSVTGASNDWYSYDIAVPGGSWHVVALDSECSVIGGCGPGSPEETWFRNDLAANPGVCTLVYWHEPRWSIGPLGNNSELATLWTDAVAGHVTLVLNGHDHDYEHFGPMDQNGNLAPNGTSEFVVGTGGFNLDSPSTS